MAVDSTEALLRGTGPVHGGAMVDFVQFATPPLGALLSDDPKPLPRGHIRRV